MRLTPGSGGGKLSPGVRTTYNTGMGYANGVGSTVTQLTSKSTGVTLNNLCGAITTHNASLAAAAEVTFTVTDNQITATDVVIVNHASGGTAGAYLLCVTAVAAGSFKITISNASAGSLSEALVINFAIIKSTSA